MRKPVFMKDGADCLERRVAKKTDKDKEDEIKKAIEQTELADFLGYLDNSPYILFFQSLQH